VYWKSIRGSIIIEGNATGDYIGARAENSSTIEVYGDSIGITSEISSGAEARVNSVITVYSDAKGKKYGVYAEDSSITVHGDCGAAEINTETGVYADLSSSNVTVKGNVYGRDYGIRTINGPQIGVEGNVRSNKCAVSGYYGQEQV
jgi:hypothetical protein